MPDYKLIELETLQTRKKDDIYKERTIKFSPHVKCEGKVNNSFYLNSKGNVFPCKHVALNLTTANNSPEHKTELLYSWDKNNINEHTLEEIFTNAIILIPFRNPIQHANSLLNQHLHFIQLQKEDDFIRRYMNYLGHNEFGLNHKPWNNPIHFNNLNNINYWLEQWNLFYESGCI